LFFRLEDYERYQARVGGATYIDITRRTDPAKIERVWDNLRAVVDRFGAPWALQLWTKDLLGSIKRGRELLAHLERQGTTVTAQYTATGLFGTKWEPCNATSPFDGATQLFDLVGGPRHLKWRFDPIIPKVHSPERFRGLAEQAAALGIEQCVVNFIARPGKYKRVDHRLANELPGWAEAMPGYDDSWCLDTLSELLEIAEPFNLTLAVCAESSRLAKQLPALSSAACGDFNWFASLSNISPVRVSSRGSRPGCGCAPYFDVGLYGQWRRCHQCLYCYAG
jgi:hypothetical protein